MKKWFTLLGYCLANFANAAGFGIYTNNLTSFAKFYHTSESSIENLYYIDLLV